MPSSDEMLRTCRKHGLAGTFLITKRAQEAAAAEGHGSADVRHALGSASSCVPDADRWKIQGPSLDGDVVTMVVTISGGELVVL